MTKVLRAAFLGIKISRFEEILGFEKLCGHEKFSGLKDLRVEKNFWDF